MSAPSEAEILASLIECAENCLIEEALRCAGLLVKGPSGANWTASVETQEHKRIGTLSGRVLSTRGIDGNEDAAVLAGKAFGIALQALVDLAELRAGGAS